MNKGKSEDRKADKASEKEARREGRDRDKDSRSDFREKNRENRERQSGGGAGEFRQQQGGPNREPGADPSNYREKAAAQRDQDTGVSDYMQQQEAARQAAAAAAAAKKSGCLPKLAMMLLPFAVLGTYLFTKS